MLQKYVLYVPDRTPYVSFSLLKLNVCIINLSYVLKVSLGLYKHQPCVKRLCILPLDAFLFILLFECWDWQFMHICISNTLEMTSFASLFTLLFIRTCIELPCSCGQKWLGSMGGMWNLKGITFIFWTYFYGVIETWTIKVKPIGDALLLLTLELFGNEFIVYTSFKLYVITNLSEEITLEEPVYHKIKYHSKAKDQGCFKWVELSMLESFGQHVYIK